jgi:hypothetical protein
MTRTGAIPLVLAACVLGLYAISAPAASPSPWLEIHSIHFTVITDAGDKKGREVAVRFEQMRAVFATLLGKDRLHQSVPLTILAFDNDKSYYQLAPLMHVKGQAQDQSINAQPTNVQPIDVPGFFLPGDDQDFIVLNLSEQESWRAIAYDFSTMLMTYNYPPAQAWFDAGLAEYFSSIRVDNKQVELGTDPGLLPSARHNFLGTHGDQNSRKSFTELLDTQAWLSLPDLFAIKPAPSGRDSRRGALFNAESWIVIHYLLHQQKLPDTGTYFNAVLNEHVPVEDAIQRAYGMSSAQLEQSVKDYFHSQSTLLTADHKNSMNAAPAGATAGQSYRFPVPVGPEDSAITSKALSEADARALYSEVAIRIPERRDRGRKELQELATAPTVADKKLEAKQQARKPREDEDNEQLPSNAIGNPLAHRILAWDHIQHGEFSEAASEIRDAGALNPGDMWLRYYVSVLKYRSAQAAHADIQGLANMMLDLRSVLEWYPELADAYDLLAVARNTGGGPAAALQAERAAISLSPRNERYVYHLAQIYVTSKKWEAANVLLDRLKASDDPQVATLARELAEQAGTERKYGIPMKGGAMAQSKLAPQKSPFDVLEEDAARRAAAENSAPSGEPQEHENDKRPTKFAKGRLATVDCSHAPAAILTVVADNATLKLRAADYKSVLLIGADDFSCDWRDRQVTVNYKPSGAKAGDLVSLEMR